MIAAGPDLLVTGPLETALFLDRPNRFVVRYRKGRRDGIAYLANPGRLGEILLPGTRLLLEKRPGARIDRHAVGAIWQSRWDGDRPRAVFLDTGRINRLAERLLVEQRIPELAGARLVRREVTVGASRFDFLLERSGAPYLLEVKSVTLAERGLAMFPDARTERGRRHVEELAHLAGPGRGSGVLFLVQGAADRFLPDFHNDLEFACALRLARGSIDLLPYRLDPVLEGGRLRFRGDPARLAIPDDLLDACVADRGLYLIVLRCDRRVDVEVGALGTLAFPPGFYVYVGSAQRSLGRRVERHLRIRKRVHWHVDFLRARCAAARAYPIRSAVVGECDLATEIRRISLGDVPSFGSSDCGCGSHLFRFEVDPTKTAAFQEVLTRLRHQPSGASDHPDPPEIGEK
jgi:sugar fermentation stimulation protein A